MTVSKMRGRFDYFWVFVPRYDAWRLGRFAGDAMIPVIENGGLWMILPDLKEDFQAVGVEQPMHPRSTTSAKT
jgi:hypothetical protein